MTSVRENILSTLVAGLQAAPSVGAPVYRSRVTPIARDEAPAIVVEPVQDQATQAVIPKLDWSLLVRVMVIVRGNVPDQIADPITQQVHARVMSDLTVGGYAYDVQPQGVAWSMGDADTPSAVVSLDYLILYRTRLTDVTQH